LIFALEFTFCWAASWFFLATLISLIALMDHPFRGEMSVSPTAFQLVYDQVMKL
jgi:hypothetical protein